MKLLISVTDEEEAVEAIEGGADIIDVKNPKEGTFGANFPWVIRKVKEVTPIGVEVSATLGDLPNIPGTAALAALGAAYSGVDYVKVGLFGVERSDDATFMVEKVCRAVKGLKSSLKVIAAGYADYERIGSLDPLELPRVACRAGAEGILVDIKEKGEKNLFGLMGVEDLDTLLEESHRYGLTVALAGSLDKDDVEEARRLGADILGIRKSACEGGDRLRGRVRGRLVRALADRVKIPRT